MSTTEHQTPKEQPQDHHRESTTKIRNRVTPMHHDPMVIFVGAAAPPRLIIACAGAPAQPFVPGAVGRAAGRGGASC